MLQLIKFIHKNKDWETLLTNEPYCISIQRKNQYIMFNYSQIESDFHNSIVKECRGIILDSQYKPVCVPFFKFGNYGESYVDNIDWDTARVQEKVDGSLIKVWHDKKWHISTNGKIDAQDAEIDAEIATDISPYETFYDLFMKAAENVGLNFSRLNTEYTYMFELISPYNRVVVPYTEVSIKHIGTRSNVTLQELEDSVGVEKPKNYGFKSLNECIQIAENLPYSTEGYVVVDDNWNRIKIKSPAYVAAHHLKNNSVITYSRIVELIRRNEDSEFLNYFPEFNEPFKKVKNKIKNFVRNINDDIIKANQIKFNTRKDFAIFATKRICPAFLFNWYDNKIDTPMEWLMNQTNNKIVQWIGVKDE